VTATREPSGGLARQELFITRVIATRVIHYANSSGVQPELFSVNAITSVNVGLFFFFCIRPIKTLLAGLLGYDNLYCSVCANCHLP
jgi:hypothetical protein